MFTKSDTTKPTSWRKTVIAALTGIACVAVGTQLFDSFEENHLEHVEVLNKYSKTLMDHGEFNANQVRVIDNLLNEGVQNMHNTAKAATASADALVEFAAAKSNKKMEILKNKGRPAVEGAQKAQIDNVKWGDKSGKDTIDTKKIARTFGDTRNFLADIKRIFPASFAAISKQRQALRDHHRDLADQIKDVELLAVNTKDNLAGSISKLALRAKYDGKGRLSPKMDAFLWKKQIKLNVTQLTESQKRCNAIIVILRKLQKDCAITQDNIENELEGLKVELKRRIARSKTQVADMEKQVAASKCKWWQAILTLGIACIKAANARKQLRVVQEKFKAELKVSERLMSQMFYFGDLVGAAANLTAQATKLLEVTKKLENRLGDARRELEQDFTDDEIDENLWDEDFAIDFAERLHDSITRVQKQCDETIVNTRKIKADLDRSLIWDDK